MLKRLLLSSAHKIEQEGICLLLGTKESDKVKNATPAVI